MSENTTVVAVKLRYSPRSYWFDPVLGQYQPGDQVLVETERGREVGQVGSINIQLSPEQVQALNSPLKPIIRSLDDQDQQQLDHLEQKSQEALEVFKELIDKSGLEMKATAVEYLFSGDKAVFYFVSESRVDFRELVRELAARLHIRVELRQIGVRDEARILNGYAHCGEQLCCARLGGEFEPVSIRMAKDQDLPLNPDKISGACGRLMCCLRYEFQTYQEFKKRAPKRGTIVSTPLGAAKIIDFDTPREVVKLINEDGKSFAVSLAGLEQENPGATDKSALSISRDLLEESASAPILLALSALDRSNSIGEETAASGSSPAADTRRRQRSEASPSNNNGSREQPSSSRSGSQPRPTSAGQPGGGDSPTRSGNSVAGESRRQRNRLEKANNNAVAANARANSGTATGQNVVPDNKPRPGRHSSGLRREAESAENSARHNPAERPAAGAVQPTGDGRRRRRQRSGGGDGRMDGPAPTANNLPN